MYLKLEDITYRLKKKKAPTTHSCKKRLKGKKKPNTQEKKGPRRGLLIMRYRNGKRVKAILSFYILQPWRSLGKSIVQSCPTQNKKKKKKKINETNK